MRIVSLSPMLECNIRLHFVVDAFCVTFMNLLVVPVEKGNLFDFQIDKIAGQSSSYIFKYGANHPAIFLNHPAIFLNNFYTSRIC